MTNHKHNHLTMYLFDLYQSVKSVFFPLIARLRRPKEKNQVLGPVLELGSGEFGPENLPKHFKFLIAGTVILAITAIALIAFPNHNDNKNTNEVKGTARSTSPESVKQEKERQPEWHTLTCEGKEIKVRPVEEQGFNITPKEDNIRITYEIRLENAEQAEIFARKGAEFEIEMDVNIVFEDIGGGVWYFSYKDPSPNQSNFGDLIKEQTDNNGNQKNKAELFRIPKLSAKDASGKFTNSISITVSENKDKSTRILAYLTANDQEWLANSRRKSPIITQFTIELVPEKR